MELEFYTTPYVINKKDENVKEDVFEDDEDDLDSEDNYIRSYKKKKLDEFIEDISSRNKEDKLKILGKHFRRNNKNKGKLILNNKKFDFKEFINIKNINEKQTKVKMILKENIQNKSYMFENCDSILELKINDNLDYIENQINFEIDYYYQENNENIIYEENGQKIYDNQEIYRQIDFKDDEVGIDEDSNTLYENSKNNISEIKINSKENNKNSILIYKSLLQSKYNWINLKFIFCECPSILTLPDISKWNTNNVTDMSGMFYNCSSLLSLPDISKWNTNNVTDMSWMFYNCSSLLTLPDISKWNTNNVTDMSGMFYNCSSLLTLPDISKWNTNNVTDMSWMFYNCSSLLSLPDISKWNTNNVTDMSDMFNKCTSLLSLPDISKWNTNNVTNMSEMFYNCSSIIALPDISKWNTNNVTNMSEMLYNCSSLLFIPNISYKDFEEQKNSTSYYNKIQKIIFNSFVSLLIKNNKNKISRDNLPDDDSLSIDEDKNFSQEITYSNIYKNQNKNKTKINKYRKSNKRLLNNIEIFEAASEHLFPLEMEGINDDEEKDEDKEKNNEVNDKCVGLNIFSNPSIDFDSKEINNNNQYNEKIIENKKHIFKNIISKEDNTKEKKNSIFAGFNFCTNNIMNKKNEEIINKKINIPPLFQEETNNEKIEKKELINNNKNKSKSEFSLINQNNPFLYPKIVKINSLFGDSNDK